MSKNTYKLTYFNVRALAEPIRWIFHYAEVPFEDHRLPWDYPNWFSNLKQNYTSTVGQIPVLTINGEKELCQSAAISRYLAGEFGLLGETNWDRARGDEAINLISDLFDGWKTNSVETDPKRKAANQAALEKKFPLYYGKLESLLKENDGPFLNGNKVTHADFWIASFLNIWNNPLSGLNPVIYPGLEQMDDSVNYVNLLDKYPALKKHQENVLGIPQIKKWLAERPQTLN